MSAAKTLLIELGTEELPPKALDELAAAFARGVVDGLVKRGFAGAFEQAKTYASPRRLAVLIPGVAPEQPEQSSVRRGPAVAAGRDANGQPSKALLGFAQSCGVAVDDLKEVATDKGAWFEWHAVKQGRSLAALLPEILLESLQGLPIPRPMRWANHDYSFVRPAHWLVVLHGTDVIDVQALGLTSGRESHGHRFMHPHAVTIADADSWLEALREANVIADQAERRQRIRAEIDQVSASLAVKPKLDEALLDEITNLTEWPVAIACTFERDFLAVPAEALITTMETNQKFVPTFDTEGGLSEHFVGVANIASRRPDEIRKGYERVIRPRFADAKFFWDEDLKTPLSTYQEALKGVTYQQALGSLWDKSVRVAELARIIANRVVVDAGAATRAAALSKCDLLTRMVGEFPELQGVMGRYYASHDGEASDVAIALDSYYQPRFAGDAIAADRVGQVLAVAERLDTLAGIFAVGMKPSGNKDPFALRRAALGLARTLIGAGFDLDLHALLIEALELTPETALQAGLKPDSNGKRPLLDSGKRRYELAEEIHQFVLERLRSAYLEQGSTPTVFEAVLAVAPSSVLDFDRRHRAVSQFGQLPQASQLAAANKRVANILRKQAEEDAPEAAIADVDPAYFEDDVERDLYAALNAARADTAALLERADYTDALSRLAQLQPAVDAFFERVHVNAEQPQMRANRLALLAQLRAQFNAIADISRL